jgi:hypothetical protein
LASLQDSEVSYKSTFWQVLQSTARSKMHDPEYRHSFCTHFNLLQINVLFVMRASSVTVISSNPKHFKTIHSNRTVLPLFEKLINLVRAELCRVSDH